MAWKDGKWNDSSDGSSMKVTSDHETMKSERISSTEKPHTHDIVLVEKTTGRVKEITIGDNRE